MANALVTMQKLANSTQLQLQRMVNTANSSQMQYNQKEAQAARDWQEKMSRSAHQMEVEDLKKAGLNPVLSSGGSGAQSYTTSSASTQNESGASALSNVTSSQLGAIGSMESSRIQAAAQKAAAAQSAAAMRAAAATSAAAQKYAADVGYKKAELQRQNVLDTLKTEKWISVNKQASSWSGVADKWFSKLTKSGAGPAMRNFNRTLLKSSSKIGTKPQAFFSNTGKITSSNFKLNANGVSSVNKILGKVGLAKTTANRNLVVKAYVFKDPNSLNRILGSYVSNHNKHGSKSISQRSVSRR